MLRCVSLRAIERCSLYASSVDRLSSVLPLIESAPVEIFWAGVYGNVVVRDEIPSSQLVPDKPEEKPEDPHVVAVMWDKGAMRILFARK